MVNRVMGLFAYEDDFLNALRKLKESGHSDLTLMTPIPLHEAQQILGEHKSAVRVFSLVGAILGAIGGFALATFSAVTFIQPTGGRAVITFPPFLVISYEMTILLGVLMTLLGFHIVSGLPAWRDAPYDARTSVDRFGVLVGGDTAGAEAIMRSSGAESVEPVEEDRA